VKTEKSKESFRLETRGQAVALCKHVGVERVGFVDITLKDYVDRLENFWPKIYGIIELVKLRYDDAVLVASKSPKSGRYHAHGLISMREDIRTGFPWSEVEGCDCRNVRKYLRDEWRWLREAAALTGAGRCSIMPVRAGIDNVCYYMTKPEEFQGAVVQFGRELTL
jgi:hypothetical protein